MHMSILWGCAVIAVLTFGVMVYSIATFRDAARPAAADFQRRPLIEVIWALIPIAIFISAALPAVGMIRASDVRVAETAE